MNSIWWTLRRLSQPANQPYNQHNITNQTRPNPIHKINRLGPWAQSGPSDSEAQSWAKAPHLRRFSSVNKSDVPPRTALPCSHNLSRFQLLVVGPLVAVQSLRRKAFVICSYKLNKHKILNQNLNLNLWICIILNFESIIYHRSIVDRLLFQIVSMHFMLFWSQNRNVGNL